MERKGIVAALAICLIGIFLFACSKPQVIDNSPPGSHGAVLPSPDENTRPNIPRVNPPSDAPDDPQYKNPGEQPHGPDTYLLPNKTLELKVAFGEPIGKRYPSITQAQYRLLRHQPVRVTGNLLVGYDERLSFDFGPNSTGRVEFGQDAATRAIGSFLHFEEGRPIFEYSVRLDRGTFYDLQGREIQILGGTYVIAEANNFSVTLFGKDVANNLVFTDGQQLYVDGSSRSDTLCSVTPNRMSYELFANGRDDGGILLAPGESLSSNVGRLRLANSLLDITYTGAPVQNATQLGLKRTRFGYLLEAELATGNAEIPLVEQDAGRLVLGKSTDRLHITPCQGIAYCIAPDDNLLLTTPDGKTYLMRYGGASEKPNQIQLYDTANNQYSYEFVGTPGVNAITDLIIDKARFRVSIGARDNATGAYNISVEQGFRNGRAEIVLKDHIIVRISDISNTTLPVEIIVPARQERLVNPAEQVIRLNLVFDSDWHIDEGNLTFVEDQNTRDTLGQTSYGATIILSKNHRSLPLNQGDQATILIPTQQAYGIVSLQG